MCLHLFYRHQILLWRNLFPGVIMDKVKCHFYFQFLERKGLDTVKYILVIYDDDNNNNHNIFIIIIMLY